MDPDADITVVYGGVNDYLHGNAPFGEYGDATPTTFCGAVRYLMNLLKQRYEGKTIVFMTPAKCRNDFLAPKGPSLPNDKRPLVEYVKIIKRTANELDIPVLDLYNGLGIDLNDDDQRIKFAPDGLHYNNQGQGCLAEKLKAFLEAL
jgi:lysophospholipase L1-like esterase